MSRSTAEQVERTRFVTANYELLQGLVILPVLAAAMVVTMTDGLFGAELASWLVLAGNLGTLAVGCLVAFAMTRYYKRQYGQVRPAQPSSGNRVIFGLFALLTVGLVLNKVLPTVPLSAAGALYGLAAIGVAIGRPPLRAPFLLIGIPLTLASLVPLGTITGGNHPLTDNDTLTATIVGAWAVVALWSHMLLRRALGPSRKDAR